LNHPVSMLDARCYAHNAFNKASGAQRLFALI